jgi:hypothetical protein
MHVIQFASLEDFMSDLALDFVSDIDGFHSPVRVQALRHQEASMHGGMVQHVAFGVTARAINLRGETLSVFVPVYRVQLFGDQGQEKEAEGWKRTSALEAAVLDTLDAMKIAYRPGIVDIGEAKLVYGTWSGRPRNGRNGDEETADDQ